MSTVAVLIPTHNRVDFLPKAIQSIAEQIHHPDVVIVIGETSQDLPDTPHRRELEGVLQDKGAVWLTNSRDPGPGGSLNTGICELLREGRDPRSTWVTVLDDDDTWETSYLAEILGQVEKEASHLAIAGIVRHESQVGHGVRLSIPVTLQTGDFLSGNPHVQNSNLVVRLDTLLLAGAYDEALPSTLDRDLMVRILDLGNARTTVVPRHLVHHWALDHPRLSSPGSKAKIEGLRLFLRKHGHRMSAAQRAAFTNRTQKLFGVMNLEWPSPPLSSTSDRPPTATGTVDIDLIVGFLLSRAEGGRRLSEDLAARLVPTGSLRSVVVYDNLDGQGSAAEVLAPLTRAGIRVRIIGAEKIQEAAEGGRLSSYYIPPKRRRGIAFGRTALQRYLHEEATRYAKPAVWILDDDVRLNDLRWGTSSPPMDGATLLGRLSSMREEGLSVAVGGVTGDPPLPALSTVRGQLLDIVEQLRWVAGGGEGANPPTLPADTAILEQFPEYYHDLSLKHHGHLEIPFALPGPGTGSLSETLGQALHALNAIPEGRPTSRQVYPQSLPMASTTVTPTRGGNTVVFDLDCLRSYPNVSPRIGEIDCRRGDTLWCVLNSRVGGSLAGHREKVVRRVPLFVRQEREGSPSRFSIEALLGDLFGRTLTRLLDSALERRSGAYPDASLFEILTLPSSEVDGLLADFDRLLEAQLPQVVLNAWRVRGLGAEIEAELRNLETSGRLPAQAELTDRALQSLQVIGAAFEEQAIEDLVARARGYSHSDLRGFLLGLAEIRRTYSRSLPPFRGEELENEAKKFLEHEFGLSELRYAGTGDEGMVFTDGARTYKYFYEGEEHFRPGHLEWLQANLAQGRAPLGVLPLKEVWKRQGRLVFISDLVVGERYRGGHGLELVDLLRGCRRAGIVIDNVHPDNLMVTDDGHLVYVDIGDDIRPFDERRWRAMAKRVYLTAKWHFRSDLRSILRRSLRDESIPELTGFPAFWDGVLSETVAAELDAPLIHLIESSGEGEVFDLGCGEGRVARELARRGYKVSAFDPDQATYPSEGEAPQGVRFLSPAQMNDLEKGGQQFDTVVCSLVLCTLPNNEEVRSVLDRVRRLVKDKGKAIVVVCNPFGRGSRESGLWNLDSDGSGSDRIPEKVTKYLHQNGRARIDWFRPFSWYKTEMLRASLEVMRVEETPGLDTDLLARGSDFLLIEARPLRPSSPVPVTLIVKACPMEWRTIEVQLRHLVGQLEGPQRFSEKVVIVDDHPGPYPRQYDSPDKGALLTVLDKLISEGVIDRVVIPSRDSVEIAVVNHRWFGIRSTSPSSSKGEPTYAFLSALETCKTDLVLQADSDCLVGRKERNHDYLGELAEVLRRDPDAVTVCMSVPLLERREYTPSFDGRKWRVESRFALLSRARMERLRPLPNDTGSDGKLFLSWYRSLDGRLKETSAQSYRGGDPRTYFIHVPNARKRPVNDWYNILRSVERGSMPPAQLGKVDLVGSTEEWVGQQKEEIVFVVRGKDVPTPKLRRCIDSLVAQADQSWGVVFMDGGSRNGMDEYLLEIVVPRFLGRSSFYANLEPLRPAENTWIAVRSFVAEPSTIIVTLDADDALTSPGVTTAVKSAHLQGADLTVGSMLRTDKEVNYPIALKEPRKARGGNVWVHPRTFRKSLFDRLDVDDLKINGEWVSAADDWAFMVPMVEMAQSPRVLTEPLYLYDPSGTRVGAKREEAESIIGLILSRPQRFP